MHKLILDPHSCGIQIELYNTMLEKEGTEGEEEARRAYRAAREKSNHAAEAAAGEKVSSTLIDRVRSSFLHLKLDKFSYVLEISFIFKKNMWYVFLCSS